MERSTRQQRREQERALKKQQANRSPQINRRAALGLVGGSTVATMGLFAGLWRPWEQKATINSTPAGNRLLSAEVNMGRTQLPQTEQLRDFIQLIANYYTESLPTNLSSDELVSRVQLIQAPEYIAILNERRQTPYPQDYVDTTPMITPSTTHQVIVNVESAALRTPSIDKMVWFGKPEAVTRSAATTFRFFMIHEFLHSDVENRQEDIEIGSNDPFKVKWVNGFNLHGATKDMPESAAFSNLEEMTVHYLMAIYNKPLTRNNELVLPSFTDEVNEGIRWIIEITNKTPLTALDIYRYRQTSDFLGFARHLGDILPANKKSYSDPLEDGLVIMNALDNANSRILRQYFS
jgi:hypothetical protein